MSFALQKNDMLLRNMIYRLHADMIGSTSSDMIFLTSSKVIDGLLLLNAVVRAARALQRDSPAVTFFSRTVTAGPSLQSHSCRRLVWMTIYKEKEQPYLVAFRKSNYI